MPDIKLYGYSTSPYVRKVAACLYYKQLPFEHVPVNPVDPSNVMEITGKRQVPVLTIGEAWKTDSTPIAMWLDELYPERPLLPSDPEQRAAILKIDDWISDMFLPSYFRGALDAKKTSLLGLEAGGLLRWLAPIRRCLNISAIDGQSCLAMRPL